MKLSAMFIAALALVAAGTAPALAQWEYAVQTDVNGVEYAKASVGDTSGNASLYTECNADLGMGLAVILAASPSMIETHGNQTAEILYRDGDDGEELVQVDYAPGEGVLTLINPDPRAIMPVWDLLAGAEENISVRFTLPPFPQVFEVVFPADGAKQAIGDLRAYCE